MLSVVAVQTKRRFKLRQIQDTGRTASHPDMGSVVVKSISGVDKQPLLPVTIHANSATGLHGQHRKNTTPNQLPSGRVSDKDTV